MNRVPHNPRGSARRDDKPWYRQFWPWFIISLPAISVIASLTTLWIAISHPDSTVPNNHENRFLETRVKAQPAAATINKKTGKPGAKTTP